MSTRFTKNVRFHQETWDYGSRLGLAAEILNDAGQPLLRNGVGANLYRVVKEAVYGPPVPVYIETLDEVPPRPLGDWEDDIENGAPRALVDVFTEPATGRRYWLRPGDLIEEAVTESLSPEQVLPLLEDRLEGWLEVVYQAGQQLAAGAMTDEQVHRLGFREIMRERAKEQGK